MLLLSSALCLAPLLGAPEEHSLPAPRTVLQRPSVVWFEGSWDELLERAAAQDRVVFVEFWTTWCIWCRKLEKVTLRDAGVVSEMEELLCFSVDAESEAGRALAERYHVKNYPTLVFLNPDGSTREIIADYYAPQAFVSEVRRIKRNEGTIGRLTERIEKAPEDLGARYELAKKLEKLGNEQGHRVQIEAILKLDPKGKSVVTRRILLSDILVQAKQDLRLEPLYSFLEKETVGDLLFPAWEAIWSYERYNVEHAKNEVARAEHLARWLNASRQLWKHAPPRLRAKIGNNVAWWIYENREYVSVDDLRFALDVAERCVNIQPKDPYVVDTLACCLYAVGRDGEAIQMIRRSIDLDPENPQWRKRLEEFQSGKKQEG